MSEDHGSVQVGQYVDAGGIRTHYHVLGEGPNVLLIHGSGPGVSAWANWGGVLPRLAARFRVYALDVVGFGKTERPTAIEYRLETWVNHVKNFMDAVGAVPAMIVGNSMGGAVALRLTAQHPEYVRALVLMGAVGVPFRITEGLDAVWGYRARGVEEMERIMDIFAFDKSLLTPDLARLRYEASLEPESRSAYEEMFPEPRQRHVDAMVTPEEDIRNIVRPTLVIHGREDQVIPVDNSYRLFNLLPYAQLHIFGRCGHWTQIERRDEFCELVEMFFGRVSRGKAGA
ncbi:2-hydroxy-6-oxo-2,4-heptadienoate hydrolase [Kyrpidia spormannii]|uniref:2-hydroxy-6-oxo-2,4-heptadienoate hydrolase n=1 Tax=Kyrpidia spormannii TaxID=2055160 RepID=A0A2K8N823_9BACL|nr:MULTISPECIES: alpha/beta hydrolase [Kyrpidia]ATY85443.1 2-hydroxy-6-oxo-2,4-heptadienoate hydrolase [Kyrpidia spormannii]MCL6575434.1 alpha/beta fold hydrolase [Kyrpidia sp.]HHY67184.1 alpha/beta fold hydrolase [Alicyclobacillus sp.]